MTTLCLILLALSCAVLVGSYALFLLARRCLREASRELWQARAVLEEARDTAGEAYCTLARANEKTAAMVAAAEVKGD